MLKTSISSFAALFFVCLLSCSPSKSRNNQPPIKEFEGVIKYKTKYYSWQDSDKSTSIQDTVTIYYSHGNLLKLHTAYPLKKEIYLSESHKYFCVHNNVDSLFWFDVTKNPKMELTNKEVTNYEKLILGYKCESLDMLILHEDRDTPFSTEIHYIFSRNNLKVDKSHLDWIKFSFFDNFIDESGCLYLGYKYVVHAHTGYKVLLSMEYEAISIKEQKVAPKTFEVDRLPLREFKL